MKEMASFHSNYQTPFKEKRAACFLFSEFSIAQTADAAQS